jgi:hypothetical protein
LTEACLFPTTRGARTREDVSERVGYEWVELLLVPEFNGLSDFVAVSGSLIEGLGNVLSDIDLFVVRAEPAPVDIRFWYPARRWLDITYLAFDDLQRTLDEVEANRGLVPADWNYRGPRLSAIDLYHRLLVGVSLTRMTLAERRGAALDQAILARELAFVLISLARNAWLDACGALQSNHYGQCGYASEIMYGYAVDAYSALLGETNPGVKWRWARVERLAADPLGIGRARHRFQTNDRAGAEEALIAAAALLFQVQMFAVTGSFVEYEHDLLPTERYEWHDGGLIRIAPSGTGFPAPRGFAARSFTGDGTSQS